MARSLNLVRVVGARPQFMQAAPLRRQLTARGHREILVHTGQHYDVCMSKVFFDELHLPAPDANLEIGSGPQGAQTGRMMAALEGFLTDRTVDALVVDGDTNSTLAGALVAAKMHLPLVHVESGLRSDDRRMPEEINRVVTDRLANLLCAPTPTAVANLQREGLAEAAVRTGDVLYDCFCRFKPHARRDVLARLGVADGAYYLATVHRAENTDDPARLAGIVRGLAALGRPVLFPAHPRTRQRLAALPGAPADGALRPIDPVGYLEMLALEAGAQCIFTDSGGVQREAFFWGRHSVVLRDTTEWTEIVASGWSALSGPRPEDILAAYETVAARGEEPSQALRDETFGGGQAAERVADAIEDLLA